MVTAGSSSGARRAGEPTSALSRPWRYSGEFEGPYVQAVQVLWLPVWLSAVGCSNNTYSSHNMIHPQRAIARRQFT